ncbi:MULTISPECIES: hypothetical protein [Cyanophyceae]|uniref:hypothetical protein n=1 Tax=Cyanophyceae TaxID=3028117 RepID=UPI00232C5C7A|nr:MULTISPECIES: hypothetical protein [Cyanophyceae]MDB9356851.1 hypothetical protein [Nodularia spumigena CS-587/03]MDB9306741.1 hypothetical protein [Nodularia spumigena CS-591/12]MDB9340609.1 hypothetical protein [Nodularia spumigena CS-589/07]MDB9344831.1 hypothetical protein [Nodularia spumigena CS-588/06]MDB9347714.1 hypothetical protein [Nodularia spumigena CS-588/01]
MSKNFATRRLLGILITCVMITSCSGRTSSNTSNGDNTSNGNNTSNQETPNDPPSTLPVTVPSLAFATTVTRNTTFGDINSIAQDLTTQCLDRFGVSQQGTTCRAEVQAAQRAAVRFINQAN